MADNGSKFSSLPGEATLYNLLPKGWTLLSTIAMGIGFAVYAWVSIEANAGAIEQMLKDGKAQSEAVQELNTKQELANQKFQLYIENEERREREQSERDREQQRVLDAILNDIRKAPAR